MKIIENILERKSKTIFKQLRKIISHLPINRFTHLLIYPFTHLPFLVLCVLSFVLVESCNTTEPGDGNKNIPPDTTSQNFTFETYEFGDGFSSSYFNDVWIFDENNIWAVGYISPEDTVLNGVKIINPNIIRWNGVKWELQPFNGTSSGIYGIWAEDSSNIYFANGAIIKYENGKYMETDLGSLGFSNGQAVEKLWGSSEENIYGVGSWGTIVYFDGQAWTKIDFDTLWRFDDIIGNKETGVAYAVATDQSFNTAIIQLRENSASIIYNSVNNINSLKSFTISSLNEKELLLGLNTIWKYNLETEQTTLLYTLTSGYAIVATAVYNAIDVYYFIDQYGPGEELLHFNGKRFKEIGFSNRNSVIYGGADAIKDLAVITGFSNNKAYLVKVIRK